jgi:hypothetical protein
MIKETPLEMSAYEWMFNTCRIPHPQEDFLQKYENKKHVTVMRHHKIYTFDVYHPDGTVLSAAEIEKW